jgi:hypothetical protein
MDRGEAVLKSDFSLSYKSRQSEILLLSQTQINSIPGGRSFSNYRWNIVFKQHPEVGKAQLNPPAGNYSPDVIIQNTRKLVAPLRLQSLSATVSNLPKTPLQPGSKPPARLTSLNVVEDHDRLALEQMLIEQSRAPSAEAWLEPGKGKYYFSEKDHAVFIEQNRRQLPQAAMVSGLGSRMVQMFLESLSLSELEPILPDFVARMGQLVCHQFGNFIPRSLITRSDAFREELTLFCVANLFALVNNKYSVTVMRKLANHSPKFSKMAFEIFRVHFDTLLGKDNDAVLLLSTLVETASDESSLEFLIQQVEKIKSPAESSPLLRVISSLVDRTTGPLLDRLSKKLAPLVPVFLDHQIGNYIVQSLIRKVGGGLVDALCKACAKDPILIFSSKYRRYVVIQLMKTEASAEFQERALRLVFRNPEQLCFVLNNIHSSNLLLAMAVKTRWESEALVKLQSLTQEVRTRDLLYSCRCFQPFLQRLKWLHSGLYALVMQALEDEEALH